MIFPVSVQVITLNEATNIGACIEAIWRTNPAEVLVIDGGSTDRTVAIAQSLGAKVLVPGRLGRGASRTLGYTNTEQPFVAMVDADDRIEEDWIEVSLHELQSGNYSAMQSSLRAAEPHNFWSSGWNQYFIESIQPALDTSMVGHPAIYRTEDLVNARQDIGHDHEDTQLSVDFQGRGLRQGIGTAISKRVVPTEWNENQTKWLAYGSGYYDFVVRHPDRKLAIRKHMFWTIPIVRAWRPVSRGKLMQPVFGLLMGASIIRGYHRKSRVTGQTVNHDW